LLHRCLGCLVCEPLQQPPVVLLLTPACLLLLLLLLLLLFFTRASPCPCRWVKIAEQMPGRSDNCLKNHWNAVQRSKRLATDRGTSASGSTFLWWYIQRLQRCASPADALAAAVAAVPACERHLLDDEELQLQDELQTPTPHAQHQQQGLAAAAAAAGGAARLPMAAAAEEGGAESQSPGGAGMQKAADALAAAAAMVVAAAARTKMSGRGMPQPAVDALAAAAAAMARAAARDTAELQPPSVEAAAAVAAANAAVVQHAAAVYAVPAAAAEALAVRPAATAADDMHESALPADCDMTYVYNSQQLLQQLQQMAPGRFAVTALMPGAATPAAAAAAAAEGQEVNGGPETPAAAATTAANAAASDTYLQQALQDAHAAAAAGNARCAVAALFAATGLATRRAGSYSSPQPKAQQGSTDEHGSWPGQQQRQALAPSILALRQQRQKERLCRLVTGALAAADERSRAAPGPAAKELPARRDRQRALEQLLGAQQSTDAAAAAAAGVNGGDGARGVAATYPTFLQQQQQQRELWQQQEAHWQLLQQQQQEEADESWEYLPDDGADATADAAAQSGMADYTDGVRPSTANTAVSFQAPPPATATAMPGAAAAAAEQPAEQLSDAEKQRVLLDTLRRLQMLPANAAAGMQLSFSLVMPPAEAAEPAAAAATQAANSAAAAAAAGAVQRASSGSSHSSESRDDTARLRTSVAAALQNVTPQGVTSGRPAQQCLAGGSAAAAAAAVAAGNTEGLAGDAALAVGSKRSASVALHDSVLSAVAAAKRVLRDAPQWMG
jgi:hypothetical protein